MPHRAYTYTANMSIRCVRLTYDEISSCPIIHCEVNYVYQINISSLHTINHFVPPHVFGVSLHRYALGVNGILYVWHSNHIISFGSGGNDCDGVIAERVLYLFVDMQSPNPTTQLYLFNLNELNSSFAWLWMSTHAITWW